MPLAPSRFVAVHFRALPLETVFSDAPPSSEGVSGCGQGPCAIRDFERGRAVLVSVSEAAIRAGVRSGLTEAEGRATCAGLVVRDREPALELSRLERAAELLFAYGPNVEVCPPSILYVEVVRTRAKARTTADELELLEQVVAGFAAVGHQVSAAMADDPSTARSFAEHLAQTKGKETSVVVPRNRARRALGDLPVQALAWTDRRIDPDNKRRIRLLGVCEALMSLGIRTVAGLHRLPGAELGARFGDAGACIAARARGEDRRPLQRYIPPQMLEESFELEAVTEDLEPVLFVIKRLLHRLEARLFARQLAVAMLTLDFVIEPGIERTVMIDEVRCRSSKRRERVEVRFARPTRSANTLFSVVREKLDGSLPGGVWAVRLIAERSESDRGVQLDLFSRRAKKIESLAELVGRLSAALGETAVFSPRIVDTHRPETAWSMEPFSVEAALKPVQSARRMSRVPFRPVMADDHKGEHRSLPEVDARLSVIGDDGEAEGRPNEERNEASDWPKPQPRRPEDEPLPPLPPRPLELFEAPEPATFLEARELLSWRGRRIQVRSTSGREHLRTEWWERDRLERDYLVVETEDGRSLWLYVNPDGSAYVHGVFD